MAHATKRQNIETAKKGYLWRAQPIHSFFAHSCYVLEPIAALRVQRVVMLWLFFGSAWLTLPLYCAAVYTRCSTPLSFSSSWVLTGGFVCGIVGIFPAYASACNEIDWALRLRGRLHATLNFPQYQFSSVGRVWAGVGKGS